MANTEAELRQGQTPTHVHAEIPLPYLEEVQVIRNISSRDLPAVSPSPHPRSPLCSERKKINKNKTTLVYKAELMAGTGKSALLLPLDTGILTDAPNGHQKGSCSRLDTSFQKFKRQINVSQEQTQ